MTDVKAQSEDHAPDQPHPSTFSPATFALLIVLAIFGAIIGIQLILQLGVTPNTSIIGALVAMILARITLFARYRSVHVQNLAQCILALPNVRYQGLSRVGHMATGSSG